MSDDGWCQLTLFVKVNRRVAINRRTDGLNRPRFGPRIATAHYRVFATTVRRSCRLLHYRDPERYTDADPLKLLWVDPEKIKMISEGPAREYGSVVDGGWDKNTSAIADDRCYQSMRQHFKDDVPWEETPLFQWLEHRIKSGEPSAWTRKQYLDRLKSVDTLYEQIDRRGYLSQRELFETSPSKTHQSNNDCVHPYINEVGVDIGRDGQLLWRSGGRHRLFSAKLLDISKIPVKIWSRHRGWQKIRTQKSAKHDHPDLNEKSD